MSFYNLDRLIAAYLHDHPDWSEATAEAEAIVLRRELHRLDRSWYDSEKRYREHTTRDGQNLDRLGA